MSDAQAREQVIRHFFDRALRARTVNRRCNTAIGSRSLHVASHTSAIYEGGGGEPPCSERTTHRFLSTQDWGLGM